MAPEVQLAYDLGPEQGGHVRAVREAQAGEDLFCNGRAAGHVPALQDQHLPAGPCQIGGGGQPLWPPPIMMALYRIEVRAYYNSPKGELMKASQLLRRYVWVLALSISTAGILAQTATDTFKPTVGQAGKDVVWVPSPQSLVDQMLDVAKVTAQDYVIDLGSGDGRTVITAAKRGATALGIEYNPDMVALSQRNAKEAGVTAKATFVKADIFESDFSKATVITMFLLPDLNIRLRPKILDLKPGTRIVSNTFTMGEWEPDDTVNVGGECPVVVHGAVLAGAGEGSGHLEAADGRARAQAGVPDGQRHADERRQGVAGLRGQAARRSNYLHGRRRQYTGLVNGNTIE